MGASSRAKGARGEREWAQYLTGAGFPANRGRQYSGSPDSPDVVCPALSCLHFEVKRVESLNIYRAIEQALGDCGDKTPAVAFRKNGGQWWVAVPADHLLELQTLPEAP